MTVKQENLGTRMDYGVVGFHQEENVSYWLFPKRLDAFAGKRVIGIDYDLLKTPVTRDSGKSPGPSSRKPAPTTPAQAPKPKPKTFRVTIRCVATVEVAREEQAENAKEAEEQALTAMGHEQIDFSKGKQARKVIDVETC